VGTIGNSVGLGEGITDGWGVGTKVVGNLVGIGVGTVVGIALGEGDGIAEGVLVGVGVVGKSVGDCDGNGVGEHVVQVISINRSTAVDNSEVYTSHVLCSIGGVFSQPFVTDS